MSRLMLLLLVSSLTFACDDGGDQTPVADAAPSTDAGQLIIDDAEVDQSVDVDQGQPDAGTEPDSPCDPTIGYGLEFTPKIIADEARFSPKAVFINNEWGLIWQTDANNAAEPELRKVWFQRIGADGDPISDPVEIGQSRMAQHALVWTGSQYMVAFISARVAGQGFGGIALQAINTQGALEGERGELQPSFDATHLSLAWAPGVGGMVVYAKGRNRAGADGLFARPVDDAGQPMGPEEQLSEAAVLSPAVAYGDASWGAAWLSRDSERPMDLMFAILDDRGRIIGDAIREESAGGQGLVGLAYGQGAYGIGWSQADAMGQLGLRLSLFDLAGDALGTTNVAGPEGFGLVTDVSWLDPNFFGIAWQDSQTGETTVGMTRVTPTAQISAPVRVTPIANEPMTGLSLSGNVSRAGAFFTHDPTPPDVGFSDASRLLFSRFAPCR
jgi:hypothetical protein